MSNELKNLVLCSGGIKGISHLGALYALSTLNCLNNIERYAGSSVGGLIVLLLIIGYSTTELFEFVKSFEFDRLKNISLLNIQLFGLDDGSKLEYTIKRLIKNKGFDEEITMQQLFDLTKKELILTTVCLNDTKLVYLSYKTFPNLPVYLAARMTTAVPLFYCPVLYENRYYVDGACNESYPISVFENEIHKTIGILLIDKHQTIDKIDNLETYIFRILECITNSISTKLTQLYSTNTIKINVENINFINYNINDKTKDQLFIEGFSSILDNIDNLLLLKNIISSSSIPIISDTSS